MQILNNYKKWVPLLILTNINRWDFVLYPMEIEKNTKENSALILY